MKLGYITPIEHLELSKKGDIIFSLIKETIENEKYRNFVKENIKQGKEVYQDANIHERERKQINFDEAMNVILKEKLCTTIIIPDEMFLTDKTLENVKDFLKKYYKKCKENKIKIMAVCQGRNIQELLKCFRILLKNKKIDRIGIPFDNSFISPDENSYVNQFYSRLYFLFKISTLNNINKKIHCLGSNGLLEIKVASMFPFVYSLDTKLFSRLALSNIKITDKNWINIIKPKQKMYFTSKFTKLQEKIFIENTRFIKNLLK